MSLIDYLSRYNQISISPQNHHKTTFTTPWGTFIYKVMAFRLKNVGPTYQRAIAFIFYDLIGNIIAIYLNDMFVLS